jgi:phage-related protein
MAKKKKAKQPVSTVEEILRLATTAQLEYELEKRTEFEDKVESIKESLMNALSELDCIDSYTNVTDDFLDRVQEQADQVYSTLSNWS